MFYEVEENRNSRRDKKLHSKYEPQINAMPMGMTKSERRRHNERKAHKHNKLGIDVNELDTELDSYSGFIRW